MLDHRPEDLVGKKIADVIGQEAFQTILPHVNAVLAGHHVEYEAEVPYKDIGPRFMHVTYAPDKDQLDRVCGWIASITDITERRQVEIALRESEEQLQRLASIVEFSDDAIVSKTLDGVITSWNRGAERLFGYTAEEAIGQPITIIIPEDRRDEEHEILTRIGRGEHIDHFETIRQPKHGSSIAVSLTISPVKDDDGKIVGASKIARNISEQKRYQKQITTLAREAEHRSKNLLATVLATSVFLNPTRSKVSNRRLKDASGRLETFTRYSPRDAGLAPSCRKSRHRSFRRIPRESKHAQE